MAGTMTTARTGGRTRITPTMATFVASGSRQGTAAGTWESGVNTVHRGGDTKSTRAGPVPALFYWWYTERMQSTWDITDEATLPEVAAAVLAKLAEYQPGGAAAVLALHGDLGAGKTTFMQTLARTLGVAEDVTSPTFVVMKQYDLNHEAWRELVHMDAYRLESVDELGPLRFTEQLARPEVIIGIEWAEKIEAALPPHTLHLTFTLKGETRTVTTADHG